MNRYTVRELTVGNRLPLQPAQTFPTFSEAVAEAVDFVTTEKDAWQATVVDANSVLVADLKRVRG